MAKKPAIDLRRPSRPVSPEQLAKLDHFVATDEVDSSSLGRTSQASEFRASETSEVQKSESSKGQTAESERSRPAQMAPDNRTFRELELQKSELSDIRNSGMSKGLTADLLQAGYGVENRSLTPPRRRGAHAGQQRRQVTSYMSPDTAQRLKDHCYRRGIEMSVAIEQAVLRYLDAEGS